MKNIKPTPKSITHKKPIKISMSLNNDKTPDNTKQTPAVNNSVVTLNM